jgi:dynein heavy chain, axonemal
LIFNFRSAEAPEDGVYIYGLFIEGASWSWATSTIQEQKPKVLIDSMPLIHLQPISLKELDQKRRYMCPVYKTNERKGILSTTGHSTNYVLPILLRTEKPAAHWIKRSVAMLCQTLD